jgi:hypothetical protein
MAPVRTLEMVDAKLAEYQNALHVYRALYYGTRLAAGLCAVVLLFVVSDHPRLSTGLSLAVLVSIVLDQVFTPRTKCQIYSRAVHALQVFHAKLRGNYRVERLYLEVLLEVNTANTQDLQDLRTFLRNVQGGGQEG